jgi:uncharacterized protein YoaH (UPF0181 family)
VRGVVECCVRWRLTRAESAPAGKVALTMTTTAIIEGWDRIGGESSRAFELFAYYRDEGLNRSLRKTAVAFNVSTRLLEKMSSRHSWQIRVRAWDREQDRQRQLDNPAAQRLMVDRHAGLATLAQQKALERIQSLGANELTVAEAIRFLEIGVKIERFSRGVPTEHVASSEDDPAWDGELLEDEELAGELRTLLLGLEQAEALLAP